MSMQPVTKPRSQLVSLDDTPYYHCIGRCVRRAYLCGSDGRHCYEHRRGWIVNRLKQLSSVFTINIAAYAIMSNHYHLVLHIDAERASKLSDTEVIERWLTLFNPPPLIQRHLQSPLADKAELEVVQQLIELWRNRLCNLSWFMRELNEFIARLANTEDHCTGHFWESRFKSQALLDETALVSCMAYVDLNPIRASMTNTPEQSDYTSIQERLGINPDKATTAKTDKKTHETELMPFAGSINRDTPASHLPFNFCDYLELIDWTGRIVREDKRGFIPPATPPILQRLNIEPKQWLNTCTHIERKFYLAIGPITKLQQFTTRLKQRWLKGTSACRALYSTG
jgi:REP element-mobilizing transposase RayT